LDPGLSPYGQEFPVPRHSDVTKSAIKDRNDIVALAGEYLSLRRVGNKYKALCPWHDDHNPSLELNPERQSFKCWVCGVGGDVFDFVKQIERVEFPEALRMLAERAGVALESPSFDATAPRGPSKTELYEVNAWAEEVFAGELSVSALVQDYIDGRGLTRQSIERFRLGYAPVERGWLLSRARRKRFSTEVLVDAGLAAGSEDPSGSVRERFRGRLMFPIHDERGRTIAFGGRILPEFEEKLASQGKHVAKYVNSPETLLFQKRTVLYAADEARAASRKAGWVAVVEGYTDVIAAHQVGLANFVGTLGTALGEDHLRALRRLADRVVLVYDADAAGQSAADRALEFFLGSDLDLRVLTLPANLDPCDYLLDHGGEAFSVLVEQAADPLNYLLSRAAVRFDLDSGEGSRRAAEWILGLMSHIPATHHLGMEVKQAKVLDTLSQRLRVPLETLNRLRRQLRRPAAKAGPASLDQKQTQPGSGDAGTTGKLPAEAGEIRQSDLDRTDLELIQIVLGDPDSISWLLPRLNPTALNDGPLREILERCFDLQNEGERPSYGNLMVRLDDPAIRSLATSLLSESALSAPDPATFPDSDHFRPAPWRERLEGILLVLDERQRQARIKALKRSLDEADQQADSDAYNAIELEYLRLLTSGRTRKS
jgi:DNA primase